MGIYKSADGMQSVGAVREATGFPAWPGSAIGRQVAVGAPSATQANILVAGLLGSPLERSASWRKGGGNFSHKVFASIFDTDSFFHIRALTSQVWFVIFHGSASTANLNNGVAARTKDGGTAWDEPYAVPDTNRIWADIVRAADGRYWGVTAEGPSGGGDRSHMEIWYNDDAEADGSWTESKNNSTGSQRMFRIVAHPTDLNKIVVLGLGDGSDSLKTWYTTDRGVTWNSNEVNTVFAALGYDFRYGAIMTAHGHLIVCGQEATTNDLCLWVSTDNGATWDKKFTGPDKTSPNLHFLAGPVGDLTSNNLLIAEVDVGGAARRVKVYRSIDEGLTWPQLSDLPELPPQSSETQDWNGGIAYDSVDGAIYLFGAGESITSNLGHVVRSRPPYDQWEDVSDALVPIDGHTSYSIADTSYGIAVIPR